MKTGGLEAEAQAGRVGVVHPEDRALQGCNPSAGWASEPAGPGGGDIAWVGQPAGPSRKRKIPGGSGDRVPPPWLDENFAVKPHKARRGKSVGLSDDAAFHAEPKHP